MHLSYMADGVQDMVSWRHDVPPTEKRFRIPWYLHQGDAKAK
jgi:hypothetical protein